MTMITVVQIARLESTAAAASYIPLSNSPILYTTLLISLCQEDTQTLNDSHFVWCAAHWGLVCYSCFVVVVFFSNKEDKWVFAAQFEKKRWQHLVNISLSLNNKRHHLLMMLLLLGRSERKEDEVFWFWANLKFCL